MNVLEVEDLSVSYRTIRAVHGVSFTVRLGEVVALLGANGAGKSTLLRAVAGVLAPEAGRVRFEGTDITGWPAHRIARRGLRLVPEGRGLTEHTRGLKWNIVVEDEEGDVDVIRGPDNRPLVYALPVGQAFNDAKARINEQQLQEAAAIDEAARMRDPAYRALQLENQDPRR